MPSTWLLLLAYLTYLALGTGVFWLLESPAAHDSSERFQRDKWALLRNFTCLDGPALDSLIDPFSQIGTTLIKISFLLYFGKNTMIF